MNEKKLSDYKKETTPEERDNVEVGGESDMLVPKFRSSIQQRIKTTGWGQPDAKFDRFGHNNFTDTFG